MSVDDREKVLRTHSLCRNCFRKGHRAKNCQSKISCRRCKDRHHTLVCFRTEEDTHSRFVTVSRSPNRNQTKENQGPSCSASSQSSQVINLSAKKVIAGETISKHSTKVLLATAVVMVRDTNGNQYPARALLDSGSESNFMTERLSQKLRVTRERVNIPVLGIGEVASKVKQRIRATILSRVSGFSREMEFLILPKVTVNLPTTSINTRGWAIPEGIQLADPTFGVPTAVDMVLGIESFFDFFESGRKVGLGDNLPILKETVFGWVVCGGLADSTQVSRVNCNVSTTKNLESLISKFWSCEEINSTNDYSLEEARCEEWFVQSVVRDDDGRYTVSLPMERDALSRLGESKNIALRRLQSTERRLTRDASLREEYISFMEEYLQLGHMRKVDGTSRESGKRCFLPHHPVVKESSTTTKVRVVFDASCKTSSGVSLNDVLLTGPVVQEDLRSIILRCRIKQIMLVADVEKMFRQIYIHPEERPLQSILWRASPKEEVCTYELNTVTYGTRPAPFLATRTLKQLATDEREKYPLAYKSIIEDTYMDDVITGSDNVEAAINLSFQLNHMMEDGGFRLRKWASNCEAVLNTIPKENLAIRDTEGINLDPDSYVRTLGLTWIPKMDVFRFQFSVPPIDEDSSITKRQVLSIIASLFDPLGLIGATIVTAKIFMQLLWTLRDNNKHVWSWNQPLPSTVGEAWKRYHKQLPGLNKIEIERCVMIPKAVHIQFHCFSDASEKAYGGCIYIRSQDTEGTVKVHLLTSKSKVAPLKCQTIPRLELCGALLVAQLYEKVQQSTKTTATGHFWTDSTCVLRWIQASPTTWSTFVANRVSKIQSLTEGSQWNHVPGICNPADLISRGITPEDIFNNEFWWHGPKWLAEEPNKWPNKIRDEVEELAEEERRRTAIVIATEVEVNDFNNWYLSTCSNYTVLIRRTAIYLRLIGLLRSPSKSCFKGFITTAELNEAERVLIHRVQQESFPVELRLLEKKESVKRSSPLRWYNPFISEDELLRIGGRLEYSVQRNRDSDDDAVVLDNSQSANAFCIVIFSSSGKIL
ncbi:uncharacterized protein LOC129781512 [Toxorhynchites rutilus septentrionalis]|uniref:uncharacterized protein LOC129781512 n=1 Tax=Toxorhynchites rutilus septentrionalis TaxID=329112 RepID=UPI00247AA48B|nr:uncharacterized protein LOC129781512 [Toxorhynchites rutilus septentrionalis]